jgi:hypothetical protein
MHPAPPTDIPDQHWVSRDLIKAANLVGPRGPRERAEKQKQTNREIIPISELGSNSIQNKDGAP